MEIRAFNLIRGAVFIDTFGEVSAVLHVDHNPDTELVLVTYMLDAVEDSFAYHYCDIVDVVGLTDEPDCFGVGEDIGRDWPIVSQPLTYRPRHGRAA